MMQSKFIIILMLCISFLILSCVKNTKDKESLSDSGNHFLIFNQDEYDFGIIDNHSNDTIVSKAFLFSNVSSKPIVIVRAYASCGCLVVKAPKDPIPSGAKDSIIIMLNKKLVKRKFYNQVYITTNIEGYKWVLRIKGDVGDKK